MDVQSNSEYQDSDEEVQSRPVGPKDAANKPARIPLLVHITKDDELSAFEQKTIRFGRWGVLLSSLSLVAAIVASYFVIQQLKEMAAQTDLLNRSAVQARIDSAQSAVTTDKQLQALQRQVSAAQRSTKIMEGELTEYRRMTDISAKQLESTERPWLRVLGAVAEGPVRFHGLYNLNAHGTDNINIAMKVVVKNVGRSVALDVATRTKVVFVSLIDRAPNNFISLPPKEQKDLCSKPSEPSLSMNLYPGEDNADDGVGTDHDEATKGTWFSFPADPEHIPRLVPMVVGCVDYRIGSSGQWHQSRFIYQLQKLVPGENRTTPLTLGEDVPKSQIVFVKFMFGGFDAC